MLPFTGGADARSFELQRLLPVFDGYPYLVSRIGHTPLRHIALMPADWPRERIARWVAPEPCPTCRQAGGVGRSQVLGSDRPRSGPSRPRKLQFLDRPHWRTRPSGSRSAASPATRRPHTRHPAVHMSMDLPDHRTTVSRMPAGGLPGQGPWPGRHQALDLPLPPNRQPTGLNALTRRRWDSTRRCGFPTMHIRFDSRSAHWDEGSLAGAEAVRARSRSLGRRRLHPRSPRRASRSRSRRQSAMSFR